MHQIHEACCRARTRQLASCCLHCDSGWTIGAMVGALPRNPAFVLFAGVGIGDGFGALEPGGVEHVAKHAGASCETRSGKVAGLGSSLPSEAAGLLELVDRFNAG